MPEDDVLQATIDRLGLERERGRHRLPAAGAARPGRRPDGRARRVPRGRGRAPRRVGRRRELDGRDAGCRSRATTGREPSRRRVCRGRSRAISIASRGAPAGTRDAWPPSPPSTGAWRAATARSPIAIAGLLPDVRLGVRATGVAERGGRVEVETGDDRIEADAAVVAVPVRLVTELAFDPPLPPEQREAFEGLRMGVASKVAVPLGGEPERCAIQCADLPVLVLGRRRRRRATPPRRDLVRGERAAAGAARDGERRSRGVGAADRRPRPRAPAGRDRGDEGVGRRPARSRGAYTAWDHPSLARRPLFERPHGAVAFAGEHTAGDHSGTMEGALRSGRRAAAQVLELLGRG